MIYHASTIAVVVFVFFVAVVLGISFYLGKDMYDKKYVFLPESITEENLTLIPVLNKQGVMIR